MTKGTVTGIPKPGYSIQGNWIMIDDYVGAKLVDETTVVIMGILIPIHYRIHDPSYVEWKLGAASDEEEFTVEERELLNVLLRVHYSNFIEAAIREAAFYENYAKSAGFEHYNDQLDAYRFVTDPLFNNEDAPF